MVIRWERSNRLKCRPYIMDLESTNGTYLNGKKIESSRYYELREGDELRFGYSTRTYILLNEHSADLEMEEERLKKEKQEQPEGQAKEGKSEENGEERDDSYLNQMIED